MAQMTVLRLADAKTPGILSGKRTVARSAESPAVFAGPDRLLRLERVSRARLSIKTRTQAEFRNLSY
jgi:hypothetical protein